MKVKEQDTITRGSLLHPYISDAWTIKGEKLVQSRLLGTNLQVDNKMNTERLQKEPKKSISACGRKRSLCCDTVQRNWQPKDRETETGTAESW